MSKKYIISLAFLLVTGCVSNVNTNPVPTVTPTSSSTVTPGGSTSPTANPSITPVPTVSPEVSATPTSSISSPIPTPTPVSNKMSKVTFGLKNSFVRITDQTISDRQKELRQLAESILDIKPSFVTIDLNQRIVDPQYNGDEDFFKWQVYDELLENLKDKNTEIFFNLNYKDPLNETSSPTIQKYKKFLEEAVKRYQQYNISWIIGDKINDINYTSGTQQDYIQFLQSSYSSIKAINSKQLVYLGAIRQSEVFSQNTYYSTDNFLSYLNLDAAKYCDGFIFEVYSLDIKSRDQQNTSSLFKGTDYKLIGNYYGYIDDILQKKNITDKKLMLVTGTYGGDVANEISQTEQQQANDLIRRVVYATSLGFDKVLLPEYFDKVNTVPADFFKKIGLVSLDYDPVAKKLSYWSFKFISEKLNGATFKSKISGLPENIDGYIFEKDNKLLYIIWNNNDNFDGNVSLKLSKSEGNLNVSPSDDNKLGSNIYFKLDNSDNSLNIPFNVNKSNIRIVEVTN